MGRSDNEVEEDYDERESTLIVKFTHTVVMSDFIAKWTRRKSWREVHWKVQYWQVVRLRAIEWQLWGSKYTVSRQHLFRRKREGDGLGCSKC